MKSQSYPAMHPHRIRTAIQRALAAILDWWDFTSGKQAAECGEDLPANPHRDVRRSASWARGWWDVNNNPPCS